MWLWISFDEVFKHELNRLRNKQKERPIMKLGDKVKDTVTGFTGIAVSKTEWLNGCTRFGVQDQKVRGGKVGEIHYFDQPQLVVVKPSVVQCGPRNTGGPIPTPQRSPNPR